jgi:hypothetical protein
MNVIERARQMLPNELKAKLRNFLPRELNINSDIVQVFVNSKGIKTRYSLTNFPSFFSPKQSSPCVYLVRLLDFDGNIFGNRRIEVPVFGTVEVKPEELFHSSLPEFGMISVNIRSSRFFSYADRHLGLITSHFYAFYHDEKTGSMALIHPQTSAIALPESNLFWKSNLFIPCKNLDYLELYQLNPGKISAQTTLYLSDENENRIFESESIMKPRSTRKIVWKMTNGNANRYVYISAKGMTGPNAKPLVFSYLKNGCFNASHS